MNASVPTAAVASPLPLARQYRVIGLVGTGHFTSHFYGLCLPPLFPYMKADLGVGYAALGLLVTLYLVASATVQLPVGMLVDRIGARRVLIGGLTVMSGGIALAGMTESYWAMAGFILFAGMGNSVFHPSDFVILSASVAPERLGRAFSLHTLAGSLGTALAPVVILVLASQLGWRAALTTVGLFGLFVMAVMVAARAHLRDTAKRRKREAGGPGQLRETLRLLSSRTILSFLLFYVATAASHSAITSFSVVVLSQVHGATLGFANTVLSAFLITAVIGVAVGGFMADRTKRHDLVMVITFSVSALCMAVAAGAAGALWVVAGALAVVGLMRGIVSPSRDLMVRDSAPDGQLGTVMAIVTIGFTTGGSIMPVIWGRLVDLGHGGMVFWISAAMMLVAIGSVFIARERSF